MADDPAWSRPARVVAITLGVVWSLLLLGCSRASAPALPDLIRYSSPPDFTVQAFIADMERATGRRIQMTECVQKAPQRIRFFRPVEVSRTEAFEFFSSVLAVYMVDVLAVAGLPGDDLLAECSDSTGLTREKMRYPFLHPSCFSPLASDRTTVISTAIPIGRVTAEELDQILGSVPRDSNKEGWGTRWPTPPWVLGQMHPSTAAAIKTGIDDANRRR